MRVGSITTLYPSFVMHGKFDTITKEENQLLAKLAWKNQETNFREAYSIADSEKMFNRSQFVNIFESGAHLDVVKKLARMADAAARKYLLDIYHYQHTGSIDMMADAFCQGAATNTHGMWTHTHVRRPLVVSYYPLININRRGSKSPSVGIDGQVNFYDPSNYGKRPFPNNNRAFNSSSIFRAPVESGDFLVFEGYLPHDSAPFDGEERVCIAIFCTPIMPVVNNGISLEKICS